MKLIECFVLIISISLFGSFFTAMLVPLTKNSIQIKKIENKLERDKFIVNAVNEVCSQKNKEKIVLQKSDLINRCSRLWNLDSFFITEQQGYYKAEWTCYKECTTFLIKKEY